MSNITIKSIKRWEKEYAFLSNDFKSPIQYGDIIYPTAYHAFVASRTKDLHIRRDVVKMSTKDLEKAYYDIGVMKGWNGPVIMLDILKIKFGLIITKQDDFLIPMVLFKKLAQTAQATLVYGNTVHDNYWGTCLCGGNESCEPNKSKNFLGNAVMEVRSKVHSKILTFTGNEYTGKCWICGNETTQRILFSNKWWPRIRGVCDDAECLATATATAADATEDKYIVTYNPTKLESIIFLPESFKEKKSKPKVEDSEDMSEQELMDYYGWNEGGVGWHGGYQGPVITVPIPERQYSTRVIKNFGD